MRSAIFRWRRLKPAWAWLGAGVLLSALGAGVLLGAITFGGLYNVAATKEHFKPVYWLLDIEKRRSIDRETAAACVAGRRRIFPAVTIFITRLRFANT